MKLLRNFSALISTLAFYWPALLILIVLTVAFLGTAEGADVISLVYESGIQAPFMLAGVVFLALVTWYSSRLTTVGKLGPVYGPLYEHLPRILGWSVYLVIELAVLLAPEMPYVYGNGAGSPNGTVMWLIVLLAIVVHIVVYSLLDRARPVMAKGFSNWQVVAWMLLLSGIMLLASHYASLPTAHVIFASCLFLTGCAFVQFVLKRRSWQRMTKAFHALSVEAELHSKIGFAGISADERLFRNFNLVALASIVPYVLAVFYIGPARVVGSTSIALLSLAILMGLGSLITIVSIKTHVRWHLILLLVAIGWGCVLSPYQVRFMPAVSDVPALDERQSLQQFLKGWVQNRADLFSENEKVPVFFVLSDGGASRSAYWVSAVLGNLQDAHPGFDRQLLGLSSTSGGSLGNGAYYAWIRSRDESNDSAGCARDLMRYVQNDFLSPTLGRLFGTDVFQHVVPMPYVNDRAASLEESMENTDEQGSYIASLLKRPINTYITSTQESSFDGPLLFLNTMRAQDGRPGLVSNIKIDPAIFHNRIDVLDEVHETGQTISLTTAAILSARFSYLSPAGGIDDSYYIDGGYFDNTGAGAIHEVLLEMERLSQNDAELGPYLKQMVVYVVRLSNNTQLQKEPSRMHPLVNDLAAPVVGLANARPSQTRTNTARLKSHLSRIYGNKDHFILLPLYRDSLANERPFSMNWVISEETLTRMEKQLGREDIRRSINRIEKMILTNPTP